MASISEVEALATAMSDHMRVLVLGRLAASWGARVARRAPSGHQPRARHRHGAVDTHRQDGRPGRRRRRPRGTPPPGRSPYQPPNVVLAVTEHLHRLLGASADSPTGRARKGVVPSTSGSSRNVGTVPVPVSAGRSFACTIFATAGTPGRPQLAPRSRTHAPWRPCFIERSVKLRYQHATGTAHWLMHWPSWPPKRWCP